MWRRSAAVLVLIGGGCLQGCSLYAQLDSCANYDWFHTDPNGAPDPCHRNDPVCPGECVIRPDPPWEVPTLFWFGSMDETPPECPQDRAPTANVFGFADIVLPTACTSCTCGPPSGSCELPTTISARAAACITPGGWATSFDPPANWDGSCTSDNAIPAGKNCGGELCVQSLSIGALTVVESDCAPVGPPPQPVGSISWKMQAVTCTGGPAVGSCIDPAQICVTSSAPPPPGLQQCTYRQGDHPCPNGYADRHVIYEGVTGNPACSACECGPPMGSRCAAKLSLFEDGNCALSLFTGYPIDSTKNVCIDIVPTGVGLGSKSISSATYEPGACQASGGNPIGGVEPANPWTVCCASPN